MTNPGNAVGTNAAYGGRTSVNAFNDGLAAYSRGILSGWACEPDTGMTVSLGGDGNTRDVAIAEDNAGNKTTINNISGSPINVTLAAAPGANSRIDAIVAYVDNPAQGASTVADNPSACGVIAVAGIAAADPSEPSDNAIRTAITADGASGPTAYYVVLATVTVASGTTDLDASMITNGDISEIPGSIVDTATLKKWVPDYSNGSSTNFMTAHTDIEVPGTGFVYLFWQGYKANDFVDVSFTVNGFTCARTVSENTNAAGVRTATLTAFFSVTAGDKVSIVRNAGTSTNRYEGYFVPGKWI